MSNMTDSRRISQLEQNLQQLKNATGREAILKGADRGYKYFLLRRSEANRDIGEVPPGSESAPSGSIPQGANAPGGIDFRTLPIPAQPRPLSPKTDNLKPNMVPQMPLVSKEELDRQWRQIEKLLSQEQLPTVEQIKQYALACCQSGVRAQALSCVAAVLRTEEECALPTEPQLRELLVELEST